MSVTPAEFAAHHGQVRPGTKALSDVVLFMEGGSVRFGGIVSVRDIAGTNIISLHAVGRAVDFMVQPGEGSRAGMTPKQVGDEVFIRLVGARGAIGAEEIIWDRQIWSPERGLHHYGGVNPHTDHVHCGVSQHVADTPNTPDLGKWFAAAIYGV